MEEQKVVFYDVFTDEPGKGNTIGIIYDPQGVVLASGFQRLATELRLSEVAVILPSQGEGGYDFEFRFFSPREEVSMCGHGTIGGLAYLYEHGKCDWEATRLRIKTGAGVIGCGVGVDGYYFMEQNLPEFYSEEIDEERVAGILGIRVSDFRNHEVRLPLQNVSTGRKKLMVPVRDLDLLLSIEPDFLRMEQYCREIQTNGFHLFTFETVRGCAGVHTRHFAPTAGVLEDAVTGNANGALGAYLVRHGVTGFGCVYVEQGYKLGRQGFLYVDVVRGDGGGIGGVMVRGRVWRRFVLRDE